MFVRARQRFKGRLGPCTDDLSGILDNTIVNSLPSAPNIVVLFAVLWPSEQLSAEELIAYSAGGTGKERNIN